MVVVVLDRADKKANKILKRYLLKIRPCVYIGDISGRLMEALISHIEMPLAVCTSRLRGYDIETHNGYDKLRRVDGIWLPVVRRRNSKRKS